MRSLLSIIMLLLCFQLCAQNKVQFQSLNQVGFLKGHGADALQYQSVNGARYKGFSLGIGAGVDYYYFRTVPLFVELKKEVLNKKETPFIFASLGSSLPWIKDPAADSWQKSEYSKGSYFEAGIGYKVPFKKRLFMIFSMGYSMKELHETRYWRMYRDFPPYDMESWSNPEYYDYTFRRISVRVGLGF